MARIALDQEVRAVALQLGVPLRVDPTAIIVERCIQTVGSWATEFGPIETLTELLNLVCDKLRLRFEVVDDDEDLKAVQQRYLKAKELGFADLDREFNATTDAVVLRLSNAPVWSSVQYVAVVDGRGHKRHRVWFSKWHEIAHLLAEPQTKFKFRRTQAFKREPIERLMDQIAGALAFFAPLFVPRLEELKLLDGIPRLGALADFASTEHPYASLHATLSAVIRHHETPMVLVEAKPGIKSGESSRSKPKLRAVTTTHNPAALRARIFLHRNMRVPKHSIITDVFERRPGSENRIQQECLSWWESSERRLPARPVTVEAIRAGSERVLALCAFVP